MEKDMLSHSEFETIQIKYFPGAPHLEKIDKGDWIDLYTNEDAVLFEGESKIIPLGVAMKLPDGYEAIVAPRSSTFKRWSVLMTNSLGIIDNKYCGNDDQWGMPVYATRNVTIPKGTRLCQFRIQKNQPDILFKEVDSLNGSNRGGWGSSGA